MKSLKFAVAAAMMTGALLLGLGFTAEPDTQEARFYLARLAWDTGDFVPALEAFKALLNGPEAEQFMERIALLTGELFQTTELARDGRSIKISPDGKLAAFESGTRSAAVTRVVSLERPYTQVAEIRGTGLAFSPDAKRIACLRVADTPAIIKCRDELDKLMSSAAADRQAQMSKQRELARLEAAAAEIILSGLDGKSEQAVHADGWLKTGLTFSADGRQVYFTGARESDTAASEICAISAEANPSPVTSGPGYKTNPVAVSGGRWLLYSVSSASPFPRPGSGDPTSRQNQGAAPASPPAAPTGQPSDPSAPNVLPDQAGRFGQPRQFVLFNLADKSSKSFSGTSPAISADGGTLVFTAQEGAESTLNLLRLDRELKTAVLKKTTDRIGSAMPAADGSVVVFDLTFTRNTEIFFIKSDGTGEQRVSREIQNDRLPRLLSSDRILAVKGEPRHSRAYLYDLKAGTSMRLFHNNTIRTLSEEYEWVADPAGNKVLIQAERDGDTISSERGIYLVELSQRITKAMLLDRINGDLAAERSLRAAGEKIYAPLRRSIQAAVEGVSITRIYEHEEALFNFDSKHISQPGNKKAAEYIYRQLQNFGYAPEFQQFESRGIKTANVLARLPGTLNPEIIYVLSGHFDSNQRGPGADDNSSATVVNLETARILARTPLPNTLIIAFCTGEESGLLGSREFVRVAKEKGWKIAADLNNDMIGWTGDHLLDNTIRYSNAGIRDLQHAAAFLFTRMITYDTRYVRSTDAVSFYDAFGNIVGGLGSYPVLGNPYYHQPSDLLETVNHQLLVEAARYNIAAISMLASSPQPVGEVKISSLENGRAVVSWAPGPEKGIKSYIVEYGTESEPSAHRLSVTTPKAILPGSKLPGQGKLVAAVKAVDARGICSWDWSRASAVLKK